MRSVRSLLIFILVIGVLCRFYRLEEKTEFLADQGSALSVVSEAWQTKQFPLLGPRTSLGFYPGPAYYYLILPVAVLTNFHPAAGGAFFCSFRDRFRNPPVLYWKKIVLGGNGPYRFSYLSLFARSHCVESANVESNRYPIF
jgi:hypothetical protein